MMHENKTDSIQSLIPHLMAQNVGKQMQ